MNLRISRRAWILLGGTVRDRRRTGEEIYAHPDLLTVITVNKRRKDTPMALLVAIRRIEGQRGAA